MKIGAGGMGTVFRAVQTNLNAPVAVKVMAESFAADVNAIAMFEREAKEIAKLRGRTPHVVQIFDFGRDAASEDYYIVMELVEGESLDRILARHGALSPVEAARIVRQAALGLEAARQHDVVHRDIKPENLLVTTEGVVKITDFGLAKSVSSSGLAATRNRTLGTPAYMSPEQADGEAVDHRSDLYSLGATFFALLTGRPPFQADTPIGLAMKHIRAPVPDPRAARADVPEPLAALTMQLLAKTRDGRPATAGDVAATLERFLAGEPAGPAGERASLVPLLAVTGPLPDGPGPFGTPTPGTVAAPSSAPLAMAVVVGGLAVAAAIVVAALLGAGGPGSGTGTGTGTNAGTGTASVAASTSATGPVTGSGTAAVTTPASAAAPPTVPASVPATATVEVPPVPPATVAPTPPPTSTAAPPPAVPTPPTPPSSGPSGPPDVPVTDCEAPAIRVDGGLTQIIEQPEVTLRGTVADTSELRLEADGAAVAVAADGTFAISRTLRPGSQTIELSATDTARNVASATVRLDYRPLPDGIILGPEPRTYVCTRDGAVMVRVESGAGAFLVDREEVSVARYARFLQAMGDEGRRHTPGEWGLQQRVGRERTPVVRVAFGDAAAFARWAGKRLPTEAEWSAAAGGPGRQWPWGDAPPGAERLVCGRGHARSGGAPEAVGARPDGAAPCGARDLAGNVAEWCQDEIVEDRTRVVKGGSFAEEAGRCRVATRRLEAPMDRLDDLGFRCVLRLAR